MVDELQRIVDGLAARIGRAVAVDDTDFRLLAYSAHSGKVDRVRRKVILAREAPREVVEWARGLHLARAQGPVRVPPNTQLGMLPRVAIAVRFQGMHFGYLWLIDPGESLTQAELDVAEVAARDAAAAIFQQRMATQLEQERAGALVRDLLAPEPQVRELAGSQLIDEGLFPATPGVVVVVARPAGTTAAALNNDQRLALAAAMQRPGLANSREHLALVRADHALLIMNDRNPGEHRRVASELHRVVAQFLGEQPLNVVVGVGEQQERLVDAHASYQQARQAVRVAEVVPSFRPVAYSSELGIYRMLGRLGTDAITPADLHPAVRALLDEDPWLLHTLEAFLDSAGDTKAVADLLNVHRATVYGRLERLEATTGINLSSGEDRLAVHLSLKLARLLGLL